MKIHLLISTIFAALLSSCAFPAMQHESMNNKFMDVTPVHASVTGTWTVAIGPFLSTYQIFSDGNGRYCYLFNGLPTIHKIKIYESSDSELKMISETGIRSSFLKGSGNTMILNSHGDKYSMKEDPDMGLANFDCKAKLESLL